MQQTPTVDDELADPHARINDFIIVITDDDDRVVDRNEVRIKCPLAIFFLFCLSNDGL